MSRRAPLPFVSGLVGGVLTGALLLGGLVSTSFAASVDDRAADLLERAQEATTAYDFTGEVRVEWRSGDRLRRERVPVRESAGVLRIGEVHQVIGAGDDRLVGSAGDWKRLWSAPQGAGSDRADVRPDRKYTLTVHDGPDVAGRDTTSVEAKRGTRLCTRFAFDDATGLLLRREQFDARGRLQRSVGFVELSDPRRTPAPVKGVVPRAEGAAPRTLADVPGGNRSPASLGVGFSLAGRYRSRDGGVQSFYTDGVYSASLFEQPGELDVAELPDGATSTDFAGRRARSYTLPSGTVAVWADDDRVYTLVSDAPKRDLDAIIRDLPQPTARDTTDDVTEFVLAPFRW